MPTSLRHDTPSIDLEEINSHWPPIADFSNETPSQRDQRLQHEREAKRINDEIDAQLEIEKSERRKRRPDIRIILLGAFLFCLVHLPPSSSFSSNFHFLIVFSFYFLFFSGCISHTGQAESGKSTILRNFQLQFAPAAFHAEAEAWRAVIDLNLVRSVTFLLNLLEESSPTSPSPSTAADAASSSADADIRPTSPSGTKILPLRRLTDDLRRLRVSLSPLRSIEECLARFISPENYPRRVGCAGSSSNNKGSRSGGSPTAALPTERAFEVSVRSGSRWKTLFKGSPGGGNGGAMSKARSQEFEEVQNARRVIEACREDIVTLWNHPAVRASLADQSVSLEFQSGLCVASDLFFISFFFFSPVVIAFIFSTFYLSYH
jgi:guanine nucleotide-binding protein alpha-1 subunit